MIFDIAKLYWTNQEKAWNLCDGTGGRGGASDVTLGIKCASQNHM